MLDLSIEIKNIIKNYIVKKNAHKDKEFQKTLLSQNHNTSNGKTNKFINLPKEQLHDILKEKNISTFLEENFYF